jgi:hypothetical protein
MQDGLKSAGDFEKSAAYGPRTFPRRSKPDEWSENSSRMAQLGSPLVRAQ